MTDEELDDIRRRDSDIPQVIGPYADPFYADRRKLIELLDAERAARGQVEAAAREVVEDAQRLLRRPPGELYGRDVDLLHDAVGRLAALTEHPGDAPSTTTPEADSE